MTGPLNAPRPSRYTALNNRPPAKRWVQWAVDRSRESTLESGLLLAGQDVVAEAEQLTAAEAERLERMRRWETSGQFRRGEPGE